MEEVSLPYHPDAPGLVEGLGALLRSCHKMLELIAFQTCFSNKSIQGLGDCLSPAAALRSLDLSSNRIGIRMSGPDGSSSGIGDLMKSVAKLPSLRSLRLCDNGIRDNQWWSVFLALMESPRLQSLDISNNRLGLEGSCALASVANHFDAIEVFEANECNLDAGTSLLVAEAVCRMSAIRSVSLNSNQLGELAALLLAQFSIVNDMRLSISRCSLFGTLSSCHHVWWTGPPSAPERIPGAWPDEGSEERQQVRQIIEYDATDPAGTYECFLLHPIHKGFMAVLARLASQEGNFAIKNLVVSEQGEQGIRTPASMRGLEQGIPTGRLPSSPDSLQSMLHFARDTLGREA